MSPTDTAYTALAMAEQGPTHRLRRALWASVAFLAGFAILIVIVAHYFLIPAADAAQHADVTGRRQLSAFSTLVLAILLFTMLVGLAMTFRIRRFFFPRPAPEKTQTQHIDAWSESARRMTAPPATQEDDDEDDYE